MLSANALPDARWQLVQWQVYSSSGNDPISYRIAPQGQPPVMGSVGRRIGFMINPDRTYDRETSPKTVAARRRWPPLRPVPVRRSADRGERSFDPVGHFDIDLQRRN